MPRLFMSILAKRLHPTVVAARIACRASLRWRGSLASMSRTRTGISRDWNRAGRACHELAPDKALGTGTKYAMLSYGQGLGDRHKACDVKLGKTTFDSWVSPGSFPQVLRRSPGAPALHSNPAILISSPTRCPVNLMRIGAKCHAAFRQATSLVTQQHVIPKAC